MMTFDKRTFNFLKDKVYKEWSTQMARGKEQEETLQVIKERNLRVTKKLNQTLLRLNLGSLSVLSSSEDEGEDKPSESDVGSSQQQDDSKQSDVESGVGLTTDRKTSKKSKSKSKASKSRSKATMLNSKSMSKNINSKDEILSGSMVSPTESAAEHKGRDVRTTVLIARMDALE